VKWKGYPITKATWENESAFSNDGDMIQQYKDWFNYRNQLDDEEQKNSKRRKTIKTWRNIEETLFH
jgi:Chromo (CHRromatin Organisation MOdifier) domain